MEEPIGIAILSFDHLFGSARGRSSGPSTNLLISLNVAFSEGHNVTNVTAELPKEGADRSTRAAQEWLEPGRFSFGAPTRLGPVRRPATMVNSTPFLSQRNSVTAIEGDNTE